MHLPKSHMSMKNCIILTWIYDPCYFQLFDLGLLWIIYCHWYPEQLVHDCCVNCRSILHSVNYMHGKLNYMWMKGAWDGWLITSTVDFSSSVATDLASLLVLQLNSSKSPIKNSVTRSLRIFELFFQWPSFRCRTQPWQRWMIPCMSPLSKVKVTHGPNAPLVISTLYEQEWSLWI